MAKGAIEISFGWLFGIIAGIAILALAIFMSSKLIQSGQESTSAKTGKEIEVLLNPLETSFNATQGNIPIEIPTRTRINNDCSPFGDFGEQKISLDQLSFKKWVNTSTRVDFGNKYIFSKSQVEGENFYVFSKPLYFPFEVSNLIYLTSEEDVYCFVDAPGDVREEIKRINQSNLQVNSSCNGTKICFGASRCDVNVDYATNSVKKKDGSIVYFPSNDNNALMYAAVFSNKDIYECQLVRLMKRAGELALLYKGKEEITSRVGCESNLNERLKEFEEKTNTLASSKDVSDLQVIVEEMARINEYRGCYLW